MHVELPSNDDDLPTPAFTGIANHSHVPTMSGGLLLNDDLIKAVLTLPDLTQRIARLGLFDHFKEKLLLAESVPERATARHGNHYCYQIIVRQAGQNLTGITHLLHPERFDTAKLKSMIDDATKVVNEVRIPKRRADMAAGRVPVKDPAETNTLLFTSDVETFEAVMMDKFQFKKLLSLDAETEIEPTVKI